MAAGEDLVIDVRGLTKQFGGRRAVDNVDLRVARGRICGFLGPNGSGKTTTIRMICGLLRPDAGEGTCLGFDIITQAAEIKRRVGYMTQRFSLYEDLSIRENLDFIARVYAVRDRKAAVARALERLGLEASQHAARGRALGRLEAASRARRVPAALAGASAPRRADGGCRSEGPARVLGAHPRACRRGHHGAREHALHG